MLNISQEVAKLILIVFSIVFTIVGIVLIVLGAIYKSKYLNYADQSIPDGYSSIKSLWIPTIIMGVIILLLTVLGFIAAFFMTTVMLLTLGSTLLVLLIFQIALGAYSLTLIKDRDVFDIQMNDKLITTFCKYKEDDSKEVVDYIQKKYECCGVTGPLWWKANRFPVPESCYNSGSSREIFQEGCSTVQSGRISHFINTISYTSLGLIIVPVIRKIADLQPRQKQLITMVHFTKRDSRGRGKQKGGAEKSRKGLQKYY